MNRRIVVLLAAVGLLALSAATRADTHETRSLLSDRGWHGIAGVQAHQPTMEAELPWVGVWTRSPLPGPYGRWLHVKMLINCDEWMQIPFAILNERGEFMLMADAIGEAPRPAWPERGSASERLVGAVCALYGYQAPHRRPLPSAGASGYVER